MTSANRILPIIAGAIAGGLIALAIASGGKNSTVTTTVITSSRPGLPTSISTTRGNSVKQIYRATSPGVVDIRVLSTSQGSSLPFPSGSQQTQGEGAGVVYDSKGDILTDEHVVAGATQVTVHFQNGRTAKARVLGTDASTDVAVIRVSVPSSDLHPIALANSSAAQVGDPVVAIGSPFSQPETATTGIVSAVERGIQAPNGFTIPGAIQTDAAINPGNSGGPLLDASAHVLGLNDQIQTSSGSNAGVGFAVPSNTVARFANQIISGQHVKHAFVGVDLNPDSAGGAQISKVQAGSPATQAGLEPGDLVTAVNGKQIASTDQFIATVDGYAPGQTVSFTLKRSGQTKTISVKLGTRPASAPNAG